ncbi:hypothetical protein BBP40_001193 [Aspergillus hancockii]|nr:hypothetical protein BBP40_001193 [Aspergillus hancockii]
MCIGILLQKFPITKILGVNVFLWGAILCCSAAAQDFVEMIALRVLLGSLEAVITPALTMYMSMWYTRAESTPRYGLWCSGLGVGQIVGGLTSFAAQHALPNVSFHGWRIMFVVIGFVNVIVSLLVLFLLPETVEKAKFLSQADRDWIAQRLREDQAGVGHKVFRWGSVVEAIGDLQTWLLGLLTILITIPSGVITTFSSILIKDFGYTSKQIPTLIGSCLMSFLPKCNQAGCLVGIYMASTNVQNSSNRRQWLHRRACISLLSTNHHIRGTVRSEQKATATGAALNAAGVDTTNLELVVISDPTDITQFSPAVAGCKGILNLASAFTYDADPGEFEEKLLIPAFKGTLTVCEAATKYPEVKKVVIMSSFAAIYDATLELQPGRVYTEKDWCPLTYEEGKNATFVPTAYRASKVIAENAAWNYVRDNEVSFQLITLCPGMVFGKTIHPIVSLAQLNASNQFVWEVLRGNAIPPTKAPVWIDVKDLAQASLQALTVDLLSHQRFLVTQGQALPKSKERISVGEPGKRIKDTHYSCDSGKVQLMLRVRFGSLRDSVVPLARQLYALEETS